MLHLYLIDYFNQTNSGLTTYVSQLSDYISKEKEIQLNFLFVKATDYKEIQKVTDQGITKYFVPHDLGIWLNHKLDDQLADYLMQETNGKDKVLFHFNWINHAPFAQQLKKKINCKTILTKHCIPWRDSITTGYPLFRTLNRQLLSSARPLYLDLALVREWVTYHSVDHILCVTEMAQNSLRHLFGFPAERTSVIRNGLGLRKFKVQDKSVLKKKYGFNQNEHIIFFAGNVNERKGVFDLVKAFDKVLESISNVRLVIAGDGDHRGIFKNTKRNWAKLTVTGMLDKKTLYDFYQMADMGVVPSYIEQCSYTTIEMMHHGLPIIVADVDGLAELVPEEYGFRTPLTLGNENAFVSPDDLAKNLLYVLKNKDVAQKRASMAKEYAAQYLTAQKMANETVRIYEKLMADTDKPVVLTRKTSGPLVSIILPCYNGEKYLKECIDSILNQTYSNFELIIIDDGSTDKTLRLLKRYKDKRMVILRNETKLGIVAGLNLAVKYAKGKFIARIDIDDMMREDRLRKQVEFLERDENQSVALVGSHHYVIDHSGNIIGINQYPVTVEEIRNAILFKNPFSHPAVMMRANVVKQIRYSGKYPHAEDYHLWFKILKKHKAFNIPECLTYYRLHGKNVSNENAKSQRDSAADLIYTELENLEIEHSVDELATHIAIGQGLKAKFFNTAEKHVSLEKWLDKVLRSQQSKYAYSDIFMYEMKDHIKRFYCGIY
jgi:glycosyltransferase involved in cell wall biosynthesis